MKVVKIDIILNCLWLRWHKYIACENNLFPSDEYALVQVESIRGIVPSLERKFELSVKNVSGCWQNEKGNEECEDGGWLSETFHVNLFNNYSCSCKDW